VWSRLQQLAGDLAQRQGKLIALQITPEKLDAIPQQIHQPFTDITIQLIQNAVIHGIESPDTRKRSNKPEHGAISVKIKSPHPDVYQLVVRDDGNGIDLEKIRNAAANLGLASQRELFEYSQQELAELIFQPFLSTQKEPTTDAGRGIGMDLVRTIVKQHLGNIQIDTESGQYTQFKVQLTPDSRLHDSMVKML